MIRPRADVAARSVADTRVRRFGARSSLSHSRWGLWLGSLIVAGGALFLVMVASSGGTAAQIPAAIQVGGQAHTVTSIVSKPKIPVPTVSTPGTQPITLPTTPTTIAFSHHTTVIKPVSTVTDRKDTGGDGPSVGGGDLGDSHSGTTTTTTTTTTVPGGTTTTGVGSTTTIGGSTTTTTGLLGTTTTPSTTTTQPG